MSNADQKPTERRKANASGRRTNDMIAEVKKGLQEHLDDCYKKGVETNLKLDDIAAHLERQDVDLAIVRDLKRFAAYGLTAIVAIEALLNIWRALSGH